MPGATAEVQAPKVFVVLDSKGAGRIRNERPGCWSREKSRALARQGLGYGVTLNAVLERITGDAGDRRDAITLRAPVAVLERRVLGGVHLLWRRSRCALAGAASVRVQARKVRAIEVSFSRPELLRQSDAMAFARRV